MYNWEALHRDLQPSYRNTVITIVAMTLLGILFFHALDGASIFFGEVKPRIQGLSVIVLSGMTLAIVLFFFGPPRLPGQARSSLPVLLLLTIVICAVIGFYSFANYAWSGDEYGYLFEADTFKAHRLWNTPPPLGIAETTTYVWIKDGKWVAQYPPGWPLILALFGGSLPTGRLANAACTAIAAYAVYELVKVRANREAAWLAVLFFALTPFTLFHGGSLFSHTSAAALSALSMLASFKAKNSPRAWQLIALGACLGMLGITRNVAALAVMIAVAIEQVRAGRLITRMVLIGLGGLPFLVGLLAYQYAITGHPTMPVYWYAGRTLDHLYFDWPSIKQGLRLTVIHQFELALFTSPVIALLWFPALWKLAKTRTFAACDLIMPLGMLIFVFYPLPPGYRIGPRYYFDFWPLAVVTIGAALPHFSARWQNLYRGALALSIVYAAIITAFLIVELRTVMQSRFDIYEVVKASTLKNAVVCATEMDATGDVYAKQEYYAAPRNGIAIGEPTEAAARDVIFINCVDTTLQAVKAAYPGRTIWEYKAVKAKQPGRLQPMPD